MPAHKQPTPVGQAQIALFQYGRHHYTYTLVRQHRKTLSLTVEPCMDIVLRVPAEAPATHIEDFLQRKWAWLNRQLTFFEKYKKKMYHKEYVSGESFYYLGRQYKLMVQPADQDAVVLSKNKLTLFTTANIHNRRHTQTVLEQWYAERQKRIFEERYAIIRQHFAYPAFPQLKSRVMAKRWGSFKGDYILLNPLLIQAPESAIDYVITHELCHVKHKNHDNHFYALLGTKCPHWQKTKEKLELLI